MRTTYSIDGKRGYAVLRIHGQVSPAGLERGLSAIFIDPNWSRDLNLMLVYENDAMLGDMTLDHLLEVHEFSQGRVRDAKLGRIFKSALVFKRPEHEAMLELHRLAELDNQLIEERVFASEDCAGAWLTT